MEKHIKILIEKYLNETATQQERLEVEQWADSSPRNQEIFYELLENWERKNAKTQWEVDATNFGLWKEGILRIDNQTMQEIAQELELHQRKIPGQAGSYV
ncbi:MAG: hypothetical protein MI921_10705 [Cytophagales bacterium]|nr:hypothetical protein [Cytophagales bacterium]